MASLRLVTAVPAWCVVCVVSVFPWRLVTGVPARCFGCAPCVDSWCLLRVARGCSVLCAVSLASWRLFTGMCALCVAWCGVASGHCLWLWFLRAPSGLARASGLLRALPVVCLVSAARCLRICVCVCDIARPGVLAGLGGPAF